MKMTKRPSSTSCYNGAPRAVHASPIPSPPPPAGKGDVDAGANESVAVPVGGGGEPGVQIPISIISTRVNYLYEAYAQATEKSHRDDITRMIEPLIAQEDAFYAAQRGVSTSGLFASARASSPYAAPVVPQPRTSPIIMSDSKASRQPQQHASLCRNCISLLCRGCIILAIGYLFMLLCIAVLSNPPSLHTTTSETLPGYYLQQQGWRAPSVKLPSTPAPHNFVNLSLQVGEKTAEAEYPFHSFVKNPAKFSYEIVTLDLPPEMQLPFGRLFRETDSGPLHVPMSHLRDALSLMSDPSSLYGTLGSGKTMLLNTIAFLHLATQPGDLFMHRENDHMVAVVRNGTSATISSVDLRIRNSDDDFDADFLAMKLKKMFPTIVREDSLVLFDPVTSMWSHSSFPLFFNSSNRFVGALDPTSVPEGKLRKHHLTHIPDLSFRAAYQLCILEGGTPSECAVKLLSFGPSLKFLLSELYFGTLNTFDMRSVIRTFWDKKPTGPVLPSDTSSSIGWHPSLKRSYVRSPLLRCILHSQYSGVRGLLSSWFPRVLESSASELAREFTSAIRFASRSCKRGMPFAKIVDKLRESLCPDLPDNDNPFLWVGDVDYWATQLQRNPPPTIIAGFEEVTRVKIRT